MKRIILMSIYLLITFQLASAAHYVVGAVENALDGEDANNKTIMIYNPINGILDKQTDIIGITGNSGAANMYMIDCELLTTPCVISDVLYIQIINSGDNYTSQIKQVTITDAGYTLASNITLNSPPKTSLIYPQQSGNISGSVNFNCSVEDLDNNQYSITLWGNWSGIWAPNETKSLSPGETYKIFNINLPEGDYKYSCFVEDNLSTGNFAITNNSFTVDNTPPIISNIQINSSSVCGTSLIRVNCTVTDSRLEISKVIIQSINPSLSRTNYSASILSGNTYFADILVNSVGNWSFNCIANDTVGNENNLISTNISSYSSEADLYITSENILLNTTPSIEFQIIGVNTTITNLGCSTANNFKVGLYEEDKDLGGTSINNQTKTISALTSESVILYWPASQGKTNLYVYTDLDNIITEYNESNNKANTSTSLTAWQEIFGNVTFNKIISNVQTTNLTAWFQETNYQGNVFITDKESTINWQNLQAIGRKIDNTPSTSDFLEIDTALSMTNFEDSVYKTFTNSGTPKSLENFSLFGYTISNVPIINSTDNNIFKTGILWDKTDDSGDNEYNSANQEDIVFITKINLSQTGKYGTYDYEIRIPANLREYHQVDTEEVYYYYELV